jgi:hypothetical protein
MREATRSEASTDDATCYVQDDEGLKDEFRRDCELTTGALPGSLGHDSDRFESLTSLGWSNIVR